MSDIVFSAFDMKANAPIVGKLVILLENGVSPNTPVSFAITDDAGKFIFRDKFDIDTNDQEFIFKINQKYRIDIRDQWDIVEDKDHPENNRPVYNYGVFYMDNFYMREEAEEFKDCIYEFELDNLSVPSKKDFRYKVYPNYSSSPRWETFKRLANNLQNLKYGNLGRKQNTVSFPIIVGFDNEEFRPPSGYVTTYKRLWKSQYSITDWSSRYLNYYEPILMPDGTVLHFVHFKNTMRIAINGTSSPYYKGKHLIINRVVMQPKYTRIDDRYLGTYFFDYQMTHDSSCIDEEIIDSSYGGKWFKNFNLTDIGPDDNEDGIEDGGTGNPGDPDYPYGTPVTVKNGNYVFQIGNGARIDRVNGKWVATPVPLMNYGGADEVFKGFFLSEEHLLDTFADATPDEYAFVRDALYVGNQNGEWELAKSNMTRKIEETIDGKVEEKDTPINMFLVPLREQSELIDYIQQRSVSKGLTPFGSVILTSPSTQDGVTSLGDFLLYYDGDGIEKVVKTKGLYNVIEKYYKTYELNSNEEDEDRETVLYGLEDEGIVENPKIIGLTEKVMNKILNTYIVKENAPLALDDHFKKLLCNIVGIDGCVYFYSGSSTDYGFTYLIRYNPYAKTYSIIPDVFSSNIESRSYGLLGPKGHIFFYKIGMSASDSSTEYSNSVASHNITITEFDCLTNDVTTFDINISVPQYDTIFNLDSSIDMNYSVYLAVGHIGINEHLYVPVCLERHDTPQIRYIYTKFLIEIDLINKSLVKTMDFPKTDNNGNDESFNPSDEKMIDMGTGCRTLSLLINGNIGFLCGNLRILIYPTLFGYSIERISSNFGEYSTRTGKFEELQNVGDVWGYGSEHLRPLPNGGCVIDKYTMIHYHGDHNLGIPIYALLSNFL